MTEGTRFLFSVGIEWGDVTDRDRYPYDIECIANLDRLEFPCPVTIFCGENGTGKSTLLEAIALAYGLNPEGGSRNFVYETYEGGSGLADVLRLSRGPIRPYDSFFVRSDTFFNLATQMDNLDEQNDRFFGGRSLHERSHGEGVLALVLNRFFGSGLYLLDEPEMGLSMGAQLTLMAELMQLVEDDSQIIMATHSPLLMAMPDACLYQFDGSIELVELEDTYEWQMLKRFSADPRGAIRMFTGR